MTYNIQNNSNSYTDIDLPDGLEALRRELSITDVMRLIERTARWVDPETFKYLPLWYPEFARRTPFYKSNWSEPQTNNNRQTGIKSHKVEGNVHANKALTHALGLRATERPNWSCCHIWGVDEDVFVTGNSIVQDRRYFSCIANMVLLPTPLKAFTDVMTEVKMMLRVCCFNLYGWSCQHEEIAATSEQVTLWTNWDAYPASWPKPKHRVLPLGVAKFTPRVRDAADRRMAAIRNDLANAGPFYPREEVLEALEYWKISI